MAKSMGKLVSASRGKVLTHGNRVQMSELGHDQRAAGVSEKFKGKYKWGSGSRHVGWGRPLCLLRGHRRMRSSRTSLGADLVQGPCKGLLRSSKAGSRPFPLSVLEQAVSPTSNRDETWDSIHLPWWKYQTTWPDSWETCTQVKKKQNQTWNSGLVPNQERSTSRLYIVTLLI